MRTSNGPTLTRYLTDREERQLLDHLKALADPLAQRDLHWIRLMRATGIRVAAFSRITVADAREALRTKYLNLPAAHQKGGRPHQVYANTTARAALKALLKVRRDLGHPEHPDAPLVPSRKGGKPLSVRSYQHRIRYWCQRAGLEHTATPHWLRHGRAISLMRQSTAADPVAVVQQVLGHRSRASTGIYLRPTREDVETALEQAR